MREMSPDDLKKFLNTNEIIETPSIEGSTELYTDGIEDALQSDKIKNVLLNDKAEVKIPSYLIDMSNIEITESALLAIKGLLDGQGTAVYIKESSGMVILVGYGEDYKLYTILDDLISLLYNKKCKLYKNTGKGYKVVNNMDVSAIRINL